MSMIKIKWECTFYFEWSVLKIILCNKNLRYETSSSKQNRKTNLDESSKSLQKKFS